MKYNQGTQQAKELNNNYSFSKYKNMVDFKRKYMNLNLAYGGEYDDKCNEFYFDIGFIMLWNYDSDGDTGYLCFGFSD